MSYSSRSLNVSPWEKSLRKLQIVVTSNRWIDRECCYYHMILIRKLRFKFQLRHTLILPLRVDDLSPLRISFSCMIYNKEILTWL